MKGMILCVGKLKDLSVSWRRDCVGTIGVKFVQKLARVLWYLDPHHDKFLARGIHIPPLFESFKGYNDYKRKKEEPRMSTDTLAHYVENLSDCVMQPWLNDKRLLPLQQPVEALLEAMNLYLHYLRKKNDSMKEHHMSLEPCQSNSNASLLDLKGPPLPEYIKLEKDLRQLGMYKPVCKAFF